MSPPKVLACSRWSRTSRSASRPTSRSFGAYGTHGPHGPYGVDALVRDVLWMRRLALDADSSALGASCRTRLMMAHKRRFPGYLG